uniref:Uncharacterized protein n=1 Tax=Glossina austeni TaxID=7395 RepID=A0A1A9VYG5_GLOAU
MKKFMEFFNEIFVYLTELLLPFSFSVATIMSVTLLGDLSPHFGRNIVITGVFGTACPVKVANSGPCQSLNRGTMCCNHSTHAELLQSTANQPGYNFANIATCKPVELTVSFSGLYLSADARSISLEIGLEDAGPLRRSRAIFRATLVQATTVLH